jgi:endonuclease G, mitochondrial
MAWWTWRRLAEYPVNSVTTGPIFQESDPVYQGVKVPVQFYKVVVVVDDAKG